MDKTIVKSYTILFGTEPDPKAEEWQIVSEILDHWNVTLLGEDLSKECLFRIINYTSFPNSELTKSVVGIAEEKITELFPELGWQDHVHMDVVAELERKYWEEKRRVQENKTEIKIK